MRAELIAQLGVDPARVPTVGVGYRADVFGATPVAVRDRDAIVFAGKLAAAKGLPWLLDAVGRVAARRPVVMHIAGGGEGDEAAALARRIAAMAPVVIAHGPLSQPALAELLRRAAVFVLPSMFEGLPLVLVEALACGCRLVATDLPGVVGELAPALGDALALVPLPRRVAVDQPVASDCEGFVRALADAIEAALDAEPIVAEDVAPRLARFTWDAVFHRVEQAWRAGTRGGS